MSFISVIVPCYNEEATIQLLLGAIAGQVFHQERLEVVIADGLSTDRTRQKIAEYQQENPELDVIVVDNPQRNIPAALNRAIIASRGDTIIRLDGHCVPAVDYFERCLADLDANLGDMVGGLWEIRPSKDQWLSRSIALAASHPFGVGDARYRYSTQPGTVDTVPFGAFRRSLVDRIGPYDETLLTNEDYEFNVRIRAAGGKIWYDPLIRSIYYARSTLYDLSSQYFRYGFWKWRMLSRNPGTLRWRQALPPFFLLSLLVLGCMAIVWNLALEIFLAEVLLYIFILMLGSIPPTRQGKDLRHLVGVPLAIATMHLCWGLGFWVSLLGFNRWREASSKA